jgi:hypothetical protein
MITPDSDCRIQKPIPAKIAPGSTSRVVTSREVRRRNAMMKAATSTTTASA